MNCRDFEKSFDEYVDGMLPPPLAARCEAHLSMCPPCERQVTRWQQTRILLSTAVAEVATAVDVSALWRDVEASLGLAATDRAPSLVRGAGATREPARESGREGRGGRRAAASGRRDGFAASIRRDGFAVAWRFTSAVAVSAVTAAAAVLMILPAASTNTATGVQRGARPVLASYSPPKKLIRQMSNGFSAVAYHPGESSPPQPRAGTQVDGIEAPQGHLISTWVQPRTNARVIWVQDRGLGAPVRTADFER